MKRYVWPEKGSKGVVLFDLDVIKLQILVWPSCNHLLVNHAVVKHKQQSGPEPHGSMEEWIKANRISKMRRPSISLERGPKSRDRCEFEQIAMTDGRTLDIRRPRNVNSQ